MRQRRKTTNQTRCGRTRKMYQRIYPLPRSKGKEGEGEMREELKNCPFCNGKAKVKVCDGSGSFYADIGTARFMGREMTHCLIRCEKCGIKTKAYLTRRGVYNAWQRRTPQNDEVKI